MNTLYLVLHSMFFYIAIIYTYIYIDFQLIFQKMTMGQMFSFVVIGKKDVITSLQKKTSNMFYSKTTAYITILSICNMAKNIYLVMLTNCHYLKKLQNDSSLFKIKKKYYQTCIESYKYQYLKILPKSSKFR